VVSQVRVGGEEKLLPAGEIVVKAVELVLAPDEDLAEVIDVIAVAGRTGGSVVCHK